MFNIKINITNKTDYVVHILRRILKVPILTRVNIKESGVPSNTFFKRTRAKYERAYY